MTYTDLRKKFKKCQENWDENIREESYKELTCAWPTKSPAQKEGMRLMIDYLNESFFNSLDYFLEEQRMEYDDRLFYCISTEEKIDLVQERLVELKDLFLAKGMFLQLLPSAFPESCCFSRFPHVVFNHLPKDIQKKIIELVPREEEVWIPEMEKLLEDFHDYERAIVEFLYLKTLHEELKLNKKKSNGFLPEISVEYPEIFKETNSLLLFNYIVKNQEIKNGNLGPAFFTKLFLYFKDEKLIYKKVKPKPYLNFLKNEHKGIKKLDERAVPDLSDIHIFEKLRENFNKLDRQ